MDKEKGLDNFSGNQLVLQNISVWSLADQEIFFSLAELFNSSGIDMWYARIKKNIIRCGIRLPRRNRDRAYLTFGEITCYSDKASFRINFEGTSLPFRQNIDLDSSVLNSIQESLSLWSKRVKENGSDRSLSSVGLWPKDYIKEDPLTMTLILMTWGMA